MKRNDILALVQPAFLREDRHIVQSRVGEALAASSYAWGTMDRLGIHTAYGTDCPVEPVNPLIGIACAVHREGGFFPDECVDIFTAVDAYTQGTAYANFDESRLGRIKPGYYADLTLLDQDIFTLPPPEIPSAKVRWTMTGGKIVYES
jgi:predicted amidohydrolase YtcJ